MTDASTAVVQNLSGTPIVVTLSTADTGASLAAMSSLLMVPCDRMSTLQIKVGSVVRHV